MDCSCEHERDSRLEMNFESASDFEVRHRRILRFFVFAVAVGSYFFDRDDIVWKIAPWHTAPERVRAHLVFLLATVLVGLAAGLRTWVRAYERALPYEFRSDENVWFADGPYRHVRHPSLLADLFFVAGLGFLLNRTGLVIASAGVIILSLRLARREEKDLRSKYGDVCGELLRLPRIVPSLRPLLQLNGHEVNWVRALRTESPDWSYCFMLLAFSITLRDGLAWGLLGAAFVVSLILNFPRRSPSPTTASAKDL